MRDLVARARAIAEDVLFPAAAEVDATGEVPRGHFDLLAAEGFYGIAVDDKLGLPETIAILEAFAGGCLSTMFIWIQHHGLVRGLHATSNTAPRARYLHDLAAGRLRGGVAYAGVIPVPPRTRARRVDGGYLFDGDAPFVSSWGVLDLLQLSGSDGDTVVSGVIDPVAGPHVTVAPLTVVAAQGTATVQLTFDDYLVPDERTFATTPYADFVAGNLFSARLIDEAGRPEVANRLRAELVDIRGRLDAGLADPSSMQAARSAASELAFRAAGALVATVGSASILAGRHGQRLVREATFLLVAAGRPEIKAGLLDLFGRNP